MDLSLEGSVGFEQDLNMEMTVQYSSAVLRGALDTGGLVPMVIHEAERLISRYKVSGTLKAPKHEKMLLPSGRSIGKKISSALSPSSNSA